MRQSHKVLVNTGSLYLKIIANALVTLVSTRIALQALGIDIYGLYNLIAGVIGLLAFFNGALMVSAQRFLSFAMGEKDDAKLSMVFRISFIVHFALALIIAVLLKSIQPYLFSGFLNIDKALLSSASSVYNIMVFSSFVTIFAIPYSAAINAREDMWFYSISEVFVSLLKLGAAIFLLYSTSNLLVNYTLLMSLAIFTGLLITFSWCNWMYKECRIKLSAAFDRSLFKEMFGFAGWNMLGSLTMVVRNQGIAVVLNIFFGTVVNAAYSVANQLNILVITFAGTLTTVFTPIIIKTKGEGDNSKMLFIASFSSKLSFFLSSLIALPVLVFTPFVLELWLKEVPAYTSEFCRMIIISFLIMQLYPGITRGLYAEGNIKWYQIVISILLVSILPVGYILFSQGFNPVYIFYVLIVGQLLTLFATIYFAKKKIELNAYDFLTKSVLFPSILFTIILVLMIIFNNNIIVSNKFLELGLYAFFGCTIYSILYFKLILLTQEKAMLVNLVKSLKEKVKRKKL